MQDNVKIIDQVTIARDKAEGLHDLLYALAESPSYGGPEFVILGDTARGIVELLESAAQSLVKQA